MSAHQTQSTPLLVQPSPYKTDCTVLVECLRELKDRQIQALGISVIGVERVTDQELERMHELGVRGIRLNFQADGKDLDIASVQTAMQKGAARIRHLPGWMIQVFIPAWTWDCK